MQHARIYNNSNKLKRRDKDSDSTNLRNSSSQSKDSNAKLNNQAMSAFQANLVVGSPSVRSRSSSVQMNRTLNTKSSENTIIVGRHYDKKFDYERSNGLRELPKKPLSQFDSMEFNQTLANYRDPTIPIQLTIWFHEMRTSSEDFMIDLNLLSNFKLGDIIEFEPIHKTVQPHKAPKKIYFIIKEENVIQNTASQNNTIGTPVLNPILQEDSQDDSFQSISETGSTATDTPVLLGIKNKNALQMSVISNPLQRILDLLPRSMVQVHKVAKPETVEADTIEISIKNLNLSRDSMWILTSELVNTCVYLTKRIEFLHNRVGVIKNIYKDGEKQFSAYIGKNTKIVYRSESSKLVFLIQTSREMWHFEESGEIMFHKLVNNLFPKIFRKWREQDAHHSITIVLFTSVDLTDIPWTAIGHGERPTKVREYFRVVVDQVNIMHWNTIMENLRLEFANYKRDIMLVENGGKHILEGSSLPSVKGNILEAINIGLSLTKDKFTDTDLKHSLNHLIVITPGTGLFDVDYNLMLETSKKMASTDCALDIICLSQPPLHIVPLFRFKDLSKNGKLSHCVPNWCDVSFFKDQTDKDQWIPRCKIYELQMMGLMENEVNDIEIERFGLFKNEKTFIESMDSYDSELFKSVAVNKDKNNSYSTINTEDLSKRLSKANSTTSLNSNGQLKAKGVNDSLLLMKKTFPTLSNKVSMAKIDVGTTNSQVLGTVSKVTYKASALTSLYHLKETDEVKSPVSRPTSSSNSVRSMISTTGFRTLQSSTSIDKLQPKIIKKEDIFKIKDPSKFNSPRSKIKKEERERSETSILKRNGQVHMSTTSLESATVEKINPFKYFWTEISNPSKELHSDALSFIKLGKWNQVFPSNIKRKLVKWRSFQSPAALPVYQPIFPTISELNSTYTTQIYSVILNFENNNGIQTSDDLMREMIQLRLLLGFQICVSDLIPQIEEEKNPGSNETLLKYYQANMSGSKIYMMLDNEIHRISSDGSTINVQLYKMIEDSKITPIFKSTEFDFKDHKPLIRTRYSNVYTPANNNFIEQKPAKYNWNQFDQLLAGYDDALPEESQSFFKMKFVVMPADIPKNAFFISNESLSDEEIRVEGLRKLINLIERGKYTIGKEANPKESVIPEIHFYTGNLYEFLDEQAETLEVTGMTSNTLLQTDKFNKAIKLVTLAHEIQSPNGIKIVDRTWHFTLHENCFVGNEFVSWLVEAFEDIHTREEAANFGQSLMERGLFKHVENRHGFLDGYYFYQFEPDYIDKTYRPEKVSWFSRKRDRDVTPTATPLPGTRNNSDTESFKSPSLLPQENTSIRKVTSIGAHLNHGTESEVSSTADSSGSKRTKRFVLSKSVKYNADPLKKSYKPEIVNVHYDKVHNPEHCYHIRLQWLNTSASFIDETINNWSRLCERHGLKFVETPWKELCTIPQVNPFHSFVDLSLALDPWSDQEFSLPKILNSNKFYYHLYLLKRSGFLLDNRSAVYFLKDNIEISYSWGKPSFKFAQFIHKTGSYIVEVRDNGNFFLAPNNMHIARINTPVSTNVDSDFNINSYTIDSQNIMLGLRKTCSSESKLREIFREAKEQWGEAYLKDVIPSDI